MNYRAAKKFILDKLRRELSQHLYYHGLHHTMDVLKVAHDLCLAEKVSGKKRVLVKTAALFHDAGFVTNQHANHEVVSCAIARAELPQFGYSSTDIDAICGMIMATKVPQSPQNLLEKIVCDADLDYLGRDDFYGIGHTLFRELTTYNLLQGEQDWNLLQVDFLSQHRFFTATNIATREPRKQLHLQQLRELIAHYG